MINGYKNLLRDLKNKADPVRAKNLAWFFKTGKGQYGEGDLFLGITVPESRKIACSYLDLSLSEIKIIIKNKYHEVRLVSILILVEKFKKADTKNKKQIYNFYLSQTKYINNWDLVDLSASYIVGQYLFDKNKKDQKILEKLAKSKNLWEKRIAIVATFYFIYKGQSNETFKIVKILMNDKHDLIHKACGWMLREVGKRVSEKDLTDFLLIYKDIMPRTMLRYSIERLSVSQKKYFLAR